MFDFTDQVILITGASGNLGSAVTRAFHAAGAKLVLADRHHDLLMGEFPELAARPECYLSEGADLTDADDVARLVNAAVARFGRIDVLANTVGGFRAGTPIHETPLDTWDFMLTLNARTVFLITRAVAPVMIDQGRGKIIHVAARPGLAGSANSGAYSAAKSAVIRLTESAAAELRAKGINVNCVIPGTLDTPENRASMPDADPGHWVAPESLARVFMFLASDAARDIHGATIPALGLT